MSTVPLGWAGQWVLQVLWVMQVLQVLRVQQVLWEMQALCMLRSGTGEAHR